MIFENTKTVFEDIIFPITTKIGVEISLVTKIPSLSEVSAFKAQHIRINRVATHTLIFYAIVLGYPV